MIVVAYVYRCQDKLASESLSGRETNDCVLQNHASSLLIASTGIPTVGNGPTSRPYHVQREEVTERVGPPAT
jgi:hypothetical protein